MPMPNAVNVVSHPARRPASVGAGRAQLPPHVVDHQQDAVERAPDDEGPAGAVPQAAEHHGEERVDVRRAGPRRPASGT